jgi:DNA-binding NarL/FixJ family response regulator
MPPIPEDHGAPGPTGVVRIAVMDEYPVLVDGLAEGLEAVPGFSVVVRASTGRELREQLPTRPCDVVVAEPWLRSDDGLDALAEVLSSRPGVTVVVFSRVWDENRVNQLMDLGARAYVPKSTPMESLPAIVQSAMAGMETRPRGTSATGGARLTTREIEVLGLAAEGLDNVAIGKHLFITERTVKFHLQNAYRKLGAANRTEAAVLARRQGFLS